MTRAGSWLARIAASPWFAYGSILAIQAKVIWDIWQYRDLTSGDTIEYFTRAAKWSTSLHLDAIWSPLDSIVLGSLQWFVHDPYAVMILYRVLLALAASLLILAILRRLLSPGIAWALAAWFAILPTYFDALYEVHFLAVVPGLIAVLLALSLAGPRMRPIVFVVFLASGLLMRNEALIAAAAWLAVWVIYEWRRREEPGGFALGPMARAALIPVAVIMAIEGLVILADPNRDQLRSASDQKHRFNLCQIYAYGYEQHNDDFTGDPWRNCRQLMDRDFGREHPTLTEAIEANPGAVGEHFLWNAQLTPAALQLLLFDRTSEGSKHNPDYIPVHTGSTFALVGSVLVLAFTAGGLVLLWRDRRGWWRRWIADRSWGWLALGCLGLSGIFVAIVARPRPEFVFSLTPVMLAVIGMAAMAYVWRWPALGRLSIATPLAALVLVAGMPSHYGPDYQTPLDGRSGRPVKATVDRLEPFAAELHGGGAGLLATYADPACHYVGREDPCRSIDWAAIEQRALGVSAAEALDQQAVDFIYVDSDDLENPLLRSIVEGLSPAEWRRVGGDQGWTLFRRASTVPPNAKASSSPT